MHFKVMHFLLIIAQFIDNIQSEKKTRCMLEDHTDLKRSTVFCEKTELSKSAKVIQSKFSMPKTM